MVHKERIIAGIEEVLEGYSKDDTLLSIIAIYKAPTRSTPEQRLDLTPKYFRDAKYSLTYQGKYVRSKGGEIEREVSPRFVAEQISGYYFSHMVHGRVKTVTKAREWLNQDLGERVRNLKLGYEAV